MPVEGAKLERFVTAHRERVLNFVYSDMSAAGDKTESILALHGLEAFVELDRDRFFQRNFPDQTIPLEVHRKIQEEAVVARAFDAIAPVGVLMLGGINESTGTALQRSVDMEFKLGSLPDSDEEIGHISRAQLYFRWGDKLYFTEEDRSSLVVTRSRLDWVPFRRKLQPSEALAWDYNQVVVTIWAEQTRLDFVPPTDQPDSKMFRTEEVVRDLQSMLPAMREAFDKPQYSKAKAIPLAV